MYAKLTSKLKHSSLLFVAAVFTAATLLSLFIPAISSAATVTKDTPLADQVLTYATYYALDDCLSIPDGQVGSVGPIYRVSEANARAGTWWKDGAGSTATGQSAIGSFLNSATIATGPSAQQNATDAGFTNCNNVLQVAVDLFGYNGDYMAFLCTFVLYRAGGQTDCLGSSPDKDFGDLGEGSNITRYRDKMRERIWSNGIPRLVTTSADSANNARPYEMAGEYLLYREAFLTACTTREGVDTYSSPVSTTRDEFIYKDVKIIKDDGTELTQTVFKGINRNQYVGVYTDPDGIIFEKCEDIAAKLGPNAERTENFEKYKRTFAEDVGGVTPPSRCSDEDTTNDTGCEIPGFVTSCGVEGIGFLVCPVLTFLGDIGDQAYKFLADNFLRIEASLVETGGGTQTAWGVMRTIANIAFVIAFLVIIFSQLTGAGVTNYGVKKLLPRIVISAILVNISFFLCQLAVDLSNIIGFGLKDVFSTIEGAAVPAVEATGSDNSSLGWAAIIVAATAGTVGILLALSMPVLLASVLAILLVVMILFARKALVVLLIIISPLAFVAFLLPNTEQLFQKWLKMFTGLLMLFPIVAVIFGASALAASIIQASSTDDMVRVIAIGVATVPFFAVPFVLKGALDSTGALGKTLSGWASKAGKNVGKNVGQNSRLGAYKNAWDRGQQIKRTSIVGGSYRGRNPFSRMSSRISGALNASSITGQMGNTVGNQAAQLAAKLEAENVDAARLQIERATLSDAQLDALAAGGKVRGINGSDSHVRAGLIEHLAQSGEYGRMETAFDRVATSGSQEARRIVAGALARSKARPGFVGQGALAELARGSTDGLAEIARQGAASGAYSAEGIAATSKQELEYVYDRADAAGHARMQVVAADAMTNADVRKTIGKNRGWVTFIAGMGGRPTP